MVPRLKTLHAAYRVTGLAASLAFYTTLGYCEVGRIDAGGGVTLTVLSFPGEDVVTLELACRPADGSVEVGTGFSHVAVQVDSLAATIEALSRSGLAPGPVERPGGANGPQNIMADRPRRLPDRAGWNMRATLALVPRTSLMAEALTT